MARQIFLSGYSNLIESLLSLDAARFSAHELFAQIGVNILTDVQTRAVQFDGRRVVVKQTPRSQGSKPSSDLALSRAVSQYAFHAQLSTKVRDCIRGQEAVRAKRTTYLPPREGQTPDEYLDFLNKAIFYNATNRTLEGLVGSVFRRPTVFEGIPNSTGEDPSDETYALPLSRITYDSNSADFMVQEFESEVLTAGRAGGLVDCPSADATIPEPYVAIYSSEQILAYGTKIVPVYDTSSLDEETIRWFTHVGLLPGREILTSVTLLEAIEESDPTGISPITYYRLRVLELVPVLPEMKDNILGTVAPDVRYVDAVELFRLNPNRFPMGVYRQRILKLLDKEGNPTSDLGTVDVALLYDWLAGIFTGNTPATVYPTKNGDFLPWIPFQFMGKNNTSPGYYIPPLNDIANLNLSHYQDYALLQTAKYLTATPVYYLKSDAQTAEQDPNNPETGGTEFYVGPKRIWLIGNEDEVGLVEYRGTGISAIANGLDDIELRIRSLGGKLVGQMPRMAAQSGVSTEMSNLSDQAILLRSVIAVESGCTNLLQWCLWWKRAPEKVVRSASVQMNRQFDVGEITPRELRAFQALYEDGLLPLEAMYFILQEAESLPREMSQEDFRRLLESDGQTPDGAGKTIVQQQIEAKEESDARKAAEDAKVRKEARLAAERNAPGAGDPPGGGSRVTEDGMRSSPARRPVNGFAGQQAPTKTPARRGRRGGSTK